MKPMKHQSEMVGAFFVGEKVEIYSQLEQHDDRTLGKYGKMRRAYLKEHRPILYNQLVLSGELFNHLYEVDEIAHERIEGFVEETVMWDEEIPDKKTDSMGWVQYMKMIKAQAEEVVYSELIFD